MGQKYNFEFRKSIKLGLIFRENSDHFGETANKKPPVN